MSNSGKPFFVFWSLLAVPTLTILISNMGDTVVQWVKDVTIWLGAVTVLPSDDADMWDQFKYGVYKSIFGAHAARHKREQKLSEKQNNPWVAGDDEEDGPHLEEPPGRILGHRLLRRRRKAHKDASQRLAADFEKSEAADEEDAKQHGNKIAEDEHHYRRQLLSEIRKVYSDSAASEPKQYTYDEWTYYIKLLGQDESDSRYHRLPRPADDAPGSHTTHQHQHGRRNSSGASDPSKAQEGSSSDSPKDGPSPTQWSWIGQKSPLIGNKDEPEWLLDKLFVKLEQSLQQQIPTTEQPRSRNEASTQPQQLAPQSISSGPSSARERSRSGAGT